MYTDYMQNQLIEDLSQLRDNLQYMLNKSYNRDTFSLLRKVELELKTLKHNRRHSKIKALPMKNPIIRNIWRKDGTMISVKVPTAMGNKAREARISFLSFTSDANYAYYQAHRPENKNFADVHMAQYHHYKALANDALHRYITHLDGLTNQAVQIFVHKGYDKMPSEFFKKLV